MWISECAFFDFRKCCHEMKRPLFNYATNTIVLPKMHQARVSVRQRLLNGSYLGDLIRVMVTNWQTPRSALLKRIRRLMVQSSGSGKQPRHHVTGRRISVTNAERLCGLAVITPQRLVFNKEEVVDATLLCIRNQNLCRVQIHQLCVLLKIKHCTFILNLCVP